MPGSLIVALAVLPCFAAAARCAGESPFGVAGNDAGVWIFRVRDVPESDATVADFVFRGADVEAPVYRRVPVRSVGGRIARYAVRGEALHLIYPDGSHRSLRLAVVGTVTSAIESVEPRLPENAVPLALAADDARRALYAVVRGEVADQLLTAPTTLPIEVGDEGGENSQAASLAPLPPPAFALVRFEPGKWIRDRDVLEGLGDRPLCWLAAYDTECHLFFAVEASVGEILYSRLSGDAWSEPVPVSGVAARDVRAVLTIDGTPVVVSGPGSKSGRAPAIALFGPADGAFARSELRLPERAALPEFAAGAFRDCVAVAFTDARGDLEVGVWPVTGGEPAEAPSVVDGLRPEPTSVWDGPVRMLMPFIVLSVVLLSVLHRRRRNIHEPAALPSHQAIARIARRAAAFLIDMAITSPGWYPLIAQHVRLTEAGPDASGQVENVLVALSYDHFWWWLASAALFALYCTVFEAALAATPGKLIMHCRVCDEQGRRCPFARVVVRNLVRCMEMFPMFQLLPSAVLMILTRKRQRLGDLVAATMVVELIRPLPGEAEEGPRQ